jgi:DNA-binding LacI/PurR family transcriptional regulator
VELRLAGVVVLRPSQIALDALYEELQRYQIPVALVDDSLTRPGTISVASDDVQGGRLAVAHLTGLGHRRIALLEGSRQPNPLLREAAFRRAMDDHGLPVPAHHVLYGNWDYLQTERETHELFRRRLDRPTALFCSAGDPFAAVAIRALRRMELRVPADVSVVGYSDLLLADCVDPPLTTIAQPYPEMGRVAVRHLLARLEEENEAPADEAGERLLPTELIVRASTAPARTP